MSLFCRPMLFLIISYLVTLLCPASLENITADERFDNIRWSNKLQMTVNVLFFAVLSTASSLSNLIGIAIASACSIVLLGLLVAKIISRQNWQLGMFGLGYRNVAVVTGTHARETPL